MAGIYLHIPFCKQACHYCNFHFSTSLKQKPDMVEALLRELDLRQDYLEGARLETIYFGGGTPSLLSGAELDRIFERIYRLFDVAPGAEVTLEANPDDLSPEKLHELRQSPVNRLSIGVQSFAETDLQFMNRAHNAREARACIANALAAGFDNLTVDLIYGAPTTADEQWEINIRALIDFGIPHISAYCLTVEERTALGHFVRAGKVKPVDEEQATRQFEILMDRMAEAGYDHYEISNFAKPGWYARHNSSYWLGDPYLGIGPSAHSYDGRSRQWNVANNARYIRILNEIALHAANAAATLEAEGLFEKEVLTQEQRHNEYVMTSLRTIWGCSEDKLDPLFREHFLEQVKPFLEQGHVIREDAVYRLSRSGKLLADHIAMELFV